MIRKLTACLLFALLLLPATHDSQASPRPVDLANASSRIFLPIVIGAGQPSKRWQRPAEANNWLDVLNTYREYAGLAPTQEDTAASAGCAAHARYIVETGTLTHFEDPASPWYSEEGHAAAQESVLGGSYLAFEPDRQKIESWLATVFHALDPLSPQLQTSGFGTYSRGVDLPNFERPDWAACMNVLRGMTGPMPTTPTLWPPKDGIQPFLEGRGEWPDPRGICGYEWPVGGYVILQASAAVQPGTQGTLTRADGQPVEACVYDQYTFGHTDPAQQQAARSSLERHRAVVLIPRKPLTPSASYSVSLVVNGSTHEWNFTTESAQQAATGG